MPFNEDSRVKIPALLHLMRLGYKYIPKRDQNKLEETNIFPEIFKESISRINPGVTENELDQVLADLTLKLDYEDLGQDFYKALTTPSGIKLVDFENFSNNSFHCTTELTCKNEDEEFRPDITVLVNGMPLVFIEVKKPNNKEGILAERERINRRYKNKKFRRFANITQLMIFSNNMEYDDGAVEPIFGAYYASSAYSDLKFNYFREDDEFPVRQQLPGISEELENFVLKDNNLSAIKYSPEFITNKDDRRPTNRIITSLLSKERLAFVLKYAIAFVEEMDERGKVCLQKHIMRYPQMFASMAIAKTLDGGDRKGIIWHTQGSGKTALAYYNVHYLTDYFQQRNIIPKFFFIVDRLDLLVQASTEFSNRGLKVNTVNSKVEFLKEIKRTTALQNHSGEREITVVNIQKFSEDAKVVKSEDYDINSQNIYFLDEAHRSYNPRGSFLANLVNSDKSAIQIALTGTPLLREVAREYDSKKLFGKYIHKYYYNRSIADGYTLRLIREQIDTNFAMQMKEILQQIEVAKGDIPRQKVYAHDKYVEPLLDYIVRDLIQFRKNENDSTLGGMIVCDSSEQAQNLFRHFEIKYGMQETNVAFLAAEPYIPYKTENPKLKAALILHDENDKEIRKDLITAFKHQKIDLLFVYNMLLTGFDAKRLKKLYLARVVKDHNLLQTLTRVNRPYKNYQYGYVVDFADIRQAFNKTNALYLNELNDELGDEMEHYSNLFKSREEIEKEIEDIRELLFQFDTNNKENFSQQIQEIKDKSFLLKITKALQNAKELRNIIRFSDTNTDLLDKIDFARLNVFLAETQRQIDSLNLLDNINNKQETEQMLNMALEDIWFRFIKVGESELLLADQVKNWMQQTREGMLRNFDHKDPQFISLREELERIFKNKNLEETTQEDMREHIHLLKSIYERVKELNRANKNLKDRYLQDEKYARVHKRLREQGELNLKETALYDALIKVKEQTDEQILNNMNIVDNDAYFEKYLMQLVINEFRNKTQPPLGFNSIKNINQLIVAEYRQQFKGYAA